MPTPSEFFTRFGTIVVTGGSSGIGFAFIKAMRTLCPEALICNLSRSIPAGFSSDLHCHIDCDLTEPGAVARAVAVLNQRIETEDRPGEILLINNSGFGDYGNFQELDLDKQLNMIDLNVRSVVELTGRMLPEIRRRGGAILSIASTAAFVPTAFMATYGASKAFVLNWSLALRNDLRESGIPVLAVCPGPTESNFFRRAGFEKKPLNAGLGMTAEAVVDESLRALAKGRGLVVTGWRNKMIAGAVSLLPKAAAARLAGAILRRMRLK